MSNDFEWDLAKEAINIEKHGINFSIAAKAFVDPKRRVVLDVKHSQDEDRYYCIAMVNQRIMIVRFVLRNGKIRIIGAGYWRNGVKFYEKKEI